jgi:trk system potassium uptake protein TrkH
MVGQLAFVLGLLTLAPCAAAALFGEPRPMALYALTASALLVPGWLARRGPPPRTIERHEALVVTAAIFALSPLVMAIPLALQGVPWLDALFEAVSGVTTTGLSTLATVEGRPRTFLFARAWMQWVGGLGFVVLSLALALGPSLATRRLGTSSLEPGDVLGSMRIHARRVLWIYLALTAFGVFGLGLLGASVFDAVVHTLAGVSTGGFAPRDTSLAALARPIQCGVLGLTLLGAVSLPLYLALGRGQPGRILRDPEVRLLGALTLAATALLGLAFRVAPSAAADGAPVSVPDFALLAVSAQTTAGFSTFDLSDAPGFAKAVVILSMITGGSHGSTAGGVKLLRVLLMVRLVQWLIGQTRLPSHAVSAGPTLSGERLESSDLLRAASLVLLFLGVVLVSWLAFLAWGYPPLDALFEVVSATGTVGLSTGISRPDLEPFLKGVLCVNMFLGRLEVFAVVVALSPRTWLGRRPA